MLITQDMSVLVQCIHSKMLKLWLGACMRIHQQQLLIILKYWTFYAPIYVEFCEKISVYKIQLVQKWKSYIYTYKHSHPLSFSLSQIDKRKPAPAQFNFKTVGTLIRLLGGSEIPHVVFQKQSTTIMKDCLWSSDIIVNHYDQWWHLSFRDNQFFESALHGILVNNVWF